MPLIAWDSTATVRTSTVDSVPLAGDCAGLPRDLAGLRVEVVLLGRYLDEVDQALGVITQLSATVPPLTSRVAQSSPPAHLRHGRVSCLLWTIPRGVAPILDVFGRRKPHWSCVDAPLFRTSCHALG